jgi:hypothetical protein
MGGEPAERAVTKRHCSLRAPRLVLNAGPQQVYPARASLLILWIGFAALFRGVTKISLAFSSRGGSAATET